MHIVSLCSTGVVALAFLTAGVAPTRGESEICVDCLQVRVGPPMVVRGPFPDELDAAFTALKLADGTFRGFSANGATYAIDGRSLSDMAGPRREVLQAGAVGSVNDCGRWLTSLARSGENLLGFVHQERDCDYERGRTEKSMAIASSSDDGLTWNDLGTVIAGRDLARKEGPTGEGDCSMVDGQDGYLYAYCLRNSDWQTIVARALPSEPTNWHKYYDGAWDEPGQGGNATAIGFLGPGAALLKQQGWIAAIATDPWFGGVRLSLSQDRVTFVDLDEPLLTIDGSEWDRPAASDLIAYGAMLNPEDGSNVVNNSFVLSYIYVPPGLGFESRYLVQHDVSLSVGEQKAAVQVGMALSRWSNPDKTIYITSTGPLTGDRLAFGDNTTIAYMLTSPPEGVESVKLAECSSNWPGHLDQILAEDGSCESADYAHERSAGWLYATEQPGTVPVYRCVNEQAQTHFASSDVNCEGLGKMEYLLGHGLAP